MAGHIYIATNHEIPHLVKVGYTERSPEERSKELSSPTGVPGYWHIKKPWLLDEPYRYEQLIHKKLDQHRRGGREFFNLTLEDAIEKINLILFQERVIDESGLSALEKEKARAYELEWKQIERGRKRRELNLSWPLRKRGNGVRHKKKPPRRHGKRAWKK